MKTNDIFTRSKMLIGNDTFAAIQQKRVIIFGVGGVGSWCAEALVRNGIQHLTIVDNDTVSISNVNRQLMATTSTQGQYKVEVLKSRLLDINPDANIIAHNTYYNQDTCESFDLNNYDYVVDAIDPLQEKALLILKATESSATLFSSMGAALKLDPGKVQVAEFWKVKGCPLGAALRRNFKKSGTLPHKKFKCVYSEELLTNKFKIEGERGNGSVLFITGTFGFRLAYLIIQDIIDNWDKTQNTVQ